MARQIFFGPLLKKFAYHCPRQWVPRLSRGYSGRGVALTTHPQLVPKLKKK